MDKKDRKEQMRELVDQWQVSGQSQKDFAAEHNLNLHTFKYWIYKFRQDDWFSPRKIGQIEFEILKVRIFAYIFAAARNDRRRPLS